MRFVVFFLLAFSAARCGVEAGNAGSGKGLVGNVKILFAQERNTGSESLSVQLGSLGLLANDDSEAATLNPSVASVDLYGSATSDNILVAESTTVPAGSYAKIAIRLTGDKPVHYRDVGGTDRDVGLDDKANSSFYITQAISITADQTTTIVINLDPSKSLQAPGGDNKFVFKPRGDAVPHDQDLNYTGTTTLADAVWVCAYAYTAPVSQEPQVPPPSLMLDNPPPPGEKGEPGTPVEGRPKFGTKPELVKDTDSSCNNAFARAPVIAGTYDFRHLLPGAYALRVFTSTGTFTDVDPDLVLHEGPKDSGQ